MAENKEEISMLMKSFDKNGIRKRQGEGKVNARMKV